MRQQPKEGKEVTVELGPEGLGLPAQRHFGEASGRQIGLVQHLPLHFSGLNIAKIEI